MKQRQIQSVNYLLVMYRNNVQPKDIEEYFNNFGLKKVVSKHLRDSVLANGVVIFQNFLPLAVFLPLCTMRDECLIDVSQPPIEHVAIFDEAQRAWNLEQTASFMLRKKQRLILVSLNLSS